MTFIMAIVWWRLKMPMLLSGNSYLVCWEKWPGLPDVCGQTQNYGSTIALSWNDWPCCPMLHWLMGQMFHLSCCICRIDRLTTFLPGVLWGPSRRCESNLRRRRKAARIFPAGPVRFPLHHRFARCRGCLDCRAFERIFRVWRGLRPFSIPKCTCGRLRCEFGRRWRLFT